MKLALKILATGAAVLGLVQVAAAAGSASLSLSPSSGNYPSGSDLTVTISEDSGQAAVNAIEADLTYDQAKLQFVSIDDSNSAFGINAKGSGGNGLVTVARAKSEGSLKGKQTVAAVKFKVLGGGAATLSFTKSSAVVDPSVGKSIWDGNTSGGSYNLSGGVVKASSAQSGQNQTSGSDQTAAKGSVVSQLRTKLKSPRWDLAIGLVALALIALGVMAGRRIKHNNL